MKGRAGGDVHAWEQTRMRRVCMTTIASRYDRGMLNVAVRYVLHERLLHFLSRGYTPAFWKSDIDMWRLAQAQ